MTHEDSIAEANRILAEAGWRPIPNPVWRGTFTSGRLVGGVDPYGNQHVKALDAVLPGDPRYGPDTPDEHHEAAAWLAARFPVASRGEAEEISPHESDSETASAPEPAPHTALHGREVPSGEGGQENADVLGGVHSANDADAGVPFSAGLGSALEGEYLDPLDPDDPALLDAPDEAEFHELEGPELGAEILDEGQDDGVGSVAHMYGDSLHIMRLAKIGAVTRKARALMPYWTTDQDAALRELRNYAAGVGEGRWPYDEGRRGELDALEAALSRMQAIETARDVKVEFLEDADRDQVEAFDPEADWP